MTGARTGIGKAIAAALAAGGARVVINLPWLQVPDQFQPAVAGFFAQPGRRR